MKNLGIVLLLSMFLISSINLAEATYESYGESLESRTCDGSNCVSTDDADGVLSWWNRFYFSIQTSFSSYGSNKCNIISGTDTYCMDGGDYLTVSNDADGFMYIMHGNSDSNCGHYTTSIDSGTEYGYGRRFYCGTKYGSCDVSIYIYECDSGPEDTCEDHDDGFDVDDDSYVSGYEDGDYFEHDDYCADSRHLYEYECDGDEYEYTYFTCLYGCDDGECQEQSCDAHDSYSCYHNDVYWYDSCGGRDEKKQECNDAGCSGGQCITDCSVICSSSWSNNACGGGSCSDTQMQQTRDCPFWSSCSESQCISSNSCQYECTSDSQCTNGVCENHECLDYFSCYQLSNNKCSSTTITRPDYYSSCSDAGMYSTLYSCELDIEEPDNTCSDSDSNSLGTMNQDYIQSVNTKGTVSGIYNGNSFSKTDYCSSDSNTVVKENYCMIGGDWNTNGFTCAWGCVDGACSDEPSQQCVDSDGGKDYYKLGTITSINQNSDDFCLGFNDGSSKTLVEFFCETDTRGDLLNYNCPGNEVCAEGRCFDPGDGNDGDYCLVSSQCDSGRCEHIGTTFLSILDGRCIPKDECTPTAYLCDFDTHQYTTCNEVPFSSDFSYYKETNQGVTIGECGVECISDGYCSGTDICSTDYQCVTLVDHCTDGVTNFDEEGIDCGGSCPIICTDQCDQEDTLLDKTCQNNDVYELWQKNCENVNIFIESCGTNTCTDGICLNECDSSTCTWSAWSECTADVKSRIYTCTDTTCDASPAEFRTCDIEDPTVDECTNDEVWVCSYVTTEQNGLSIKNPCLAAEAGYDKPCSTTDTTQCYTVGKCTDSDGGETGGSSTLLIVGVLVIAGLAIVAFKK